MAILRSHGVLLVNSIPTHTPTAEQAKLARLEDGLTFFYYNGTAWLTIRLDAPETYTGSIIPDNADLGTALQSLESAIEGITADGNHTPIVRTNGTQNVAPTSGEVPSPKSGDTADVNLTTGKLEKWVHNGTAWSRAFVIDYKDVTDLTYQANPTNGVVESSTGANATIPLVDATNAGLMSAAQKSKLDFISVTQAVDLDTMESAIATALQTVTDTNTVNLTKTGTDIKADVKISATQGSGVTVTAESDGIKVAVDQTETEPTGYISKAAAVTALGAGKKFQYLAANLDGAVEGTVAWT